MGVHIDPVTLRARIEAACRELGIGDETCSPIVKRVLGESGSRRESEARDRLRNEIARARAERDRFLALRQEIQRRLGTESVQRVVHDLRNVLNDVALLLMVTGERS
jgi:hypothetical protein